MLKSKFNFFTILFFSIFTVTLVNAEVAKIEYVDILSIAKQLKAQLLWDPLTESGSLEKDGHCVSFRLNEPIVMLDYRKLAITDSPCLKNNELLVSKAFQKTVEDLFKTIPPETHFRVGAILIDAGHGGKDPGALDTHTINGKKVTVREKDITLNVAKELNTLLKNAYPDKQILMTRSTDVFLSLEQRVNIANSVKLEPHEAIIYISIHVNAAFDKKASGYEVWYLSPGYRRTVLDNTPVEKELLPILNSMMEEEFTTESILIAKFILNSLDAEIGSQSVSRGIKAEEWFVVRNANMPSVLVEVGFLTNQKEGTLLNDKAYLRKLATGIYNGLAEFVTHFENSRGFTGIK